jgi:hypothetical protein
MEPDLFLVVFLAIAISEGTMSKANEYYARGAECKVRANETTDPDFRREFEQLAEKWNDLGIQEEIDGDSVLIRAYATSQLQREA